MKKIFLVMVLCSTIKSYSQNPQVNISKKIDSIYKYWDKQFTRKLLDQHLAAILPLDEDFNFISKNSVLYRKEIIAVMADRKQKKEVRYFALLTLQLQCENEYRVSLHEIYKLFKKKQITENLLISAIRQDDFSLEVIKNASSKEYLKLFLINLSKDLTISKENRAFIKTIITPDYYKSYKEQFDQVGEKPYECK
jgi:hypothetical protein